MNLSKSVPRFKTLNERYKIQARFTKYRLVFQPEVFSSQFLSDFSTFSHGMKQKKR